MDLHSSPSSHDNSATVRELDGLTCLVVGGGGSTTTQQTSIGMAISISYARAGATVIVCDHSEDAGNATVSRIVEERNIAHFLSLDAASPDSIETAVANALDRFGKIDVLHYNVGIGKAERSSATSHADWDRISQANVTGLHVSAQAVLPSMISNKFGVILATSSIASIRYVGFPHLAYGATKAAVNQYCRLIALEYATRGVRSNSIVVGFVDTPRIRTTVKNFYGDEEEMIAKRNAQVPLGFMGNAWDVANAAVFLASPRARYISGTELVVDGALSASI